MFDGVTGLNQISLCMIVKNEEASIEKAILSVKKLVREIVVVDTGSEDQTKEVARRFGAQVYDYKWEDHFSKARNFGLQKATREWILVLDADESISERDFPKIKEVLQNPLYDGAYFYQRNYFEDPSAENWCVNKTDYAEAKKYAGYADVLALRLFRNIPEIYYEGVVHESVDETMKKRKVRYLEMPIHHYRKDSFRTISNEKKEKYLGLLQKEYQENPFSVKACFLLGRQYYDLDRYPEAIGYLKRAVNLGTKSEIVFENLAAAFYQCGMHDEVIETLDRVIQFNPRYAEAYATIALSYYEKGIIAKAINSLVKAIHLKPTSIRYYFNLAALYYRERDFEAAETHLKEAVKLAPKFTRCYYLLFHIKYDQEKWDEALELGKILERLDPSLFGPIEEKVKQLEAKKTSVS